MLQGLRSRKWVFAPAKSLKCFSSRLRSSAGSAVKGRLSSSGSSKLRVRQGRGESFFCSSILYFHFHEPGKKPKDVREPVEIANRLGIDIICSIGETNDPAFGPPAGRPRNIQSR